MDFEDIFFNDRQQAGCSLRDGDCPEWAVELTRAALDTAVEMDERCVAIGHFYDMVRAYSRADIAARAFFFFDPYHIVPPITAGALLVLLTNIAQ